MHAPGTNRKTGKKQQVRVQMTRAIWQLGCLSPQQLPGIALAHPLVLKQQTHV